MFSATIPATIPVLVSAARDGSVLGKTNAAAALSNLALNDDNRIQNEEWWRRFGEQRAAQERATGQAGASTEILWHGTHSTAPKTLLLEMGGLDFRHARRTGFLVRVTHTHTHTPCARDTRPFTTPRRR